MAASYSDVDRKHVVLTRTQGSESVVEFPRHAEVHCQGIGGAAMERGQGDRTTAFEHPSGHLCDRAVTPVHEDELGVFGQRRIHCTRFLFGLQDRDLPGDGRV